MLYAAINFIVAVVLIGFGAAWAGFLGLFLAPMAGGDGSNLRGAYITLAVAALGLIPIGLGLWRLIIATSAIWKLL